MYDKAAQARYKKKCVQLKVVLYPTDTDIIEFLKKLGEPKATLVKRLLREEMRRQETASTPKD